MVFIFIFKVLISLPLGILTVWKNRGQLLDRPEWYVIPELTIYFVFFALFILGSYIFPFFSQDIKYPGIIDIAGLFFVICLIIYKLGLNETLLNKLTDKQDRNEDNESNRLMEKQKYHKELFSYLSYTVIYIAFIFSSFTLIELLVLNFIPYSSLGDISEVFVLDKIEGIFEWELTEMRLISIMGMGFTLCQMIENFKFSKEKMKKDRIANIKEYLEETSVKN